MVVNGVEFAWQTICRTPALRELVGRIFKLDMTASCSGKGRPVPAQPSIKRYKARTWELYVTQGGTPPEVTDQEGNYLEGSSVELIDQRFIGGGIGQADYYHVHVPAGEKMPFFNADLVGDNITGNHNVGDAPNGSSFLFEVV